MPGSPCCAVFFRWPHRRFAPKCSGAPKHVSPLSNSADSPTPRESAPQYAENVLTVRRIPWRHDLAIISAAGDVDTDSVRLLQRALWQDLPACLVLDLSEVTYFGSAGVRALEGAVGRACAERRRIGIVSASRTVLVPLQISGIDTRVGIYPILADAQREVPLFPPPPAASSGA